MATAKVANFDKASQQTSSRSSSEEDENDDERKTSRLEQLGKVKRYNSIQ